MGSCNGVDFVRQSQCHSPIQGAQHRGVEAHGQLAAAAIVEGDGPGVVPDLEGEAIGPVESVAVGAALGDADAVEAAMHDKVAAVLVEPILQAFGDVNGFNFILIAMALGTLVGLIWGIAVYIRAVQISQEFSGGKTVLITFLPVLILLLLAACIGSAAFASLIGVITAGQ